MQGKGQEDSTQRKPMHALRDMHVLHVLCKNATSFNSLACNKTYFISTWFTFLPDINQHLLINEFKCLVGGVVLWSNIVVLPKGLLNNHHVLGFAYQTGMGCSMLASIASCVYYVAEWPDIKYSPFKKLLNGFSGHEHCSFVKWTKSQSASAIKSGRGKQL